MRLVLLFAMSLFSLPAWAASDPWTGTWDTRWRDGGARLELHQTGDKVEGKYAAYNGAVEGTVVDRVFKGQWHQGARSGGFDFVLAPDGKSFVGRYASGEWWTGARIAISTNASEIVDLSTPRAALRTFVRGGNSARYDAPDEMVRSVQAVDFGDANLTPEAKLARTRALFDLVDSTTFRLFSIPDEAAGDSLSVTLNQDGSTAKMPLQFKKHGNRWTIVMPDETTIAGLAKTMYARTNGAPANPAEYKLRHTASDAYRTFTHGFYDWNDGGRADAMSALDLSGIPPAIRAYQGELAAQYLALVMNRVGLPEVQEIPDDPGGVHPYILFSHPLGQIAIAPVGANKPTTWAFTRGSVESARKLYAVVEDLPPATGWSLPLPPSLFFSLRRHVRLTAPWLLADLGPIEVWQIFGWIAVLAVSLVAGFLLTEVLMRVALSIVGTRDGKADRRVFRWAMRGATSFSIYKLLIPMIGLTDVAKQVSVGVTGILLIVSVMWLGWISIDAFGDRFFTKSDGMHVTMDNIIVSLLFGVLKLGLIVLGLTLIAIELSLPYEGIIASLSIGGLAVAFASRETLSNVFGAGVLAIDRPFKRGDFISAGGVDGTVEHVGIRSTRVRTSDDSLIIIPNGKLSDAFVNNLGSRRYHAGSLKLPLPYSTSVSQLEELMDGTRKIVEAIPEVAPQRTSLALSTIGKDGIQLAVSYSLDVRRGGNDVAVTNRLVLDILKLCERLGIRADAAEPAAA